MTNDAKSVAKSFSIHASHLVDIQDLADKYGMCDSEVVQMAIDVLTTVEKKNLMMQLLKMTMDRK